VPVFAPGYSSSDSTDQEVIQRKGRDAGKTMMRQMDTDGDGLISREEFRSILSDSPELDCLSNYDMRLMRSQSIDGESGAPHTVEIGS
jgi:Ca2+-binding EF-hand superfamily protein